MDVTETEKEIFIQLLRKMEDYISFKKPEDAEEAFKLAKTGFEKNEHLNVWEPLSMVIELDNDFYKRHAEMCEWVYQTVKKRNEMENYTLKAMIRLGVFMENYEKYRNG